ncbi:MAG TPA: hypothetical protein VNJ47_00270 [Nevskiales bacterium]|nr:hypothetical protein [Nevskiales bacterium]
MYRSATIAALLTGLLAACATVPPTDAELADAAARARQVDRTVLRLQLQDLCWRVYDGKHGCYLPP